MSLWSNDFLMSVACFSGVLFASTFGSASPRSAGEPGYVGKTVIYDYGDLVIEARFVSATKLHWKQVQGPEVGSSGEETYESRELRPDLFFFSWQEKNGLVVTQVVDFTKLKVHSVIITPDKQMVRMEGSIRPPEP